MLPKHIKISLASKMSYFMDILEFISYSIARVIRKRIWSPLNPESGPGLDRCLIAAILK